MRHIEPPFDCAQIRFRKASCAVSADIPANRTNPLVRLLNTNVDAVFSSKSRLSLLPKRLLVRDDNTVFAAELAKFFHCPAHGFSVSRNAEQVLADHPARNAHNLGNFPLGFAVFEIQDRGFKLFLRQGSIQEGIDLRDETFDPVFPVVARMLVFGRFVPQADIVRHHFQVRLIELNFPKIRIVHLSARLLQGYGYGGRITVPHIPDPRLQRSDMTDRL